MKDSEITEWFVNLPEYKSYVDAIGAYNPELDYAGPEGKFISKFIPSTFYGIELNICFYQHDALHEIGGTKKDRWLADMAMLGTGLYIIENHPNRWYLYGASTVRRHLARVRLIKYFEIVRHFGKPHFNFSAK